MKKSKKFRPFNKWLTNKKVFNNISFVIFCPKHKQIALSSCENHCAFGFPFIYLSSYMKINHLIEDFLCFILSNGETDLILKYKEVLPFDTNVSHVLSLRLRQFKFGFTRFVCFVRLHSDNPVLKCHENNSFFTWCDEKQIKFFVFMDQLDPEATKFIYKFDEYMKAGRNEFEFIQDHISHPISGTYYSKIKQRDINLLTYENLKL